MKKYVPFLAALWLSSVFMGCTVVNKKYYVKNEERMAAVDRKMKEHDQAIANLTNSHQNMWRTMEEGSRKSAEIDANCTQIQESLIDLDTKIEARNNVLDKKIAETRKSLDALEVRLTKKEFTEKSEEIEKAKIDLQNQLIQLLYQKASEDSHSETTQSLADPKIGRKREMPDDEFENSGYSSPLQGDDEEDFDYKGDKNVLQKLLDEALTLYRDEKYKPAIKKWQEVLKIDPENLEAKFIIEIATEKMNAQKKGK